MSAGITQIGLAEDVVRHKHSEALASLIEGEVRFGRHDRMLYSTDASLYQVEPIGVVVPASADDVLRAVKYCVENRLPILPRGGGTSLAGQCTNHAVVMDFSANCRGVLETHFDGAEPWCRVESGITIEDLNDQIVAAGGSLFFAPDPATSRQANIGGCIGNNAAGTRSILYGRTAENLIGVDVALAQPGAPVMLFEAGAASRARSDEPIRHITQGVIDIVQRHARLIRERFPKTIRRNAGYALDMMLDQIEAAQRQGRSALETVNLAHLICGSEGTLGITLRAKLKLHPLPKAKGLVVLGFDSLEKAIDAVVPLVGLNPSAVELLDDLIVSLARRNAEYERYVRLLPQPKDGALAAVLYVEFFSNEGAAEIESSFEATRALMQRICPDCAVACLTDANQMLQALKLRKAGEPLLHGIPGKRKPLGFVEDNVVPVERLAEFVREFKRIVAEHGTTASFWAHASVGVLHVRPLLSLRDDQDLKRMEDIAVRVADLARSLGGVMSGEHGDGRVRGPLLERHFGPELMRAFKEVKDLFDPLGVLNPGNIVAPGPIASIHETTRVRPTGVNTSAPNIDTYFDYSEADGFDHAVELCNGAGVCRKKQGGTMCPSYMATLDERHSTRGRGNALRLAITGQLHEKSEPEWGDPETLETLHLCLSCKACKTECPSNVDVAKYKAEYTAQTYRAAGRVPLKARIMGHVRVLNQLGSLGAPLSNRINATRFAKAMAQRFLGIAPKRSLPAFEESLFKQARVAKEIVPDGFSDDAPRIILFPDCFTTYNEPRVGRAAIRVLHACGYRVVIPKVGCCGRAAISMGLLDDARSMIRATANALNEAMHKHDAQAIVFCEPSCLSAIKDEWQTIKSAIHPELAKEIAGRSWLIEQFINDQWEVHPRRPEFGAWPGRLVLHGHCHQKALWGAESSAALLRRIPSAGVNVLDTGCCGMAGSFGYTTDRYDLSMRIGELSLFPAARALTGDDVLIAPGTSCRHQVQDGTGVRSMHPIEIVASVLE